MPKLTHINDALEAEMVDISAKSTTKRTAVAEALVRMSPSTLAELMSGNLPKGDALSVARIAGIQAAKRTSDLIPLCHPLALTNIKVRFESVHGSQLKIQTEASVNGQTGVEMEALTAASVAALTVYDMCKAVQKDISIEKLHLVKKTGGKSGAWQAL